MSAYIRNFEIIPTIGSFITDIDLGVSSVPLSGIVNFISLPGLTSFKIKNGAFERFENILSCSGLNVFDVADGHLSLSTVVSCLSVFSDRKAIYPELTSNVKLSGLSMPVMYRVPKVPSLDYEFNRLYNFLVSEPYSWNIIVNPEPDILRITLNNQTLSILTTGAQSSYLIVKNDINNFSFLLNNYDGVYITNFYDASALSACYITLAGTSQVTANTDTLFVGQSAILSAIDGSLHTFFYFNTGSLLLGIAPTNVNLPALQKDPGVTTPTTPIVYVMPPRYGYINGNLTKSFNANTLNEQTTYVMLNTATKLFSLRINETSVLSGFNWFKPNNGPLSSSYISITSVQNLQPSVGRLPFEKRVNEPGKIGLTAEGFKVYDVQYFYTSDSKIVLAVGNQFTSFDPPTNYYDSYIVTTSTTTPTPTALPSPATTLPPPANTQPPFTVQPGITSTQPPVITTTQPPVITTTQPPVITTIPPVVTTAPPITLTTTTPIVTITTIPPTTTTPPFTVPPITTPPATTAAPTTTPPATTAAPTTTPPATTAAPTTTPPPGPTTPPPPTTVPPPITTPPPTTPAEPPPTTAPPVTTTIPPTVPPVTTAPPVTSPPAAQTTYVEYEIVDTDVDLNPPGEDIEIIN